MRAAANNRLLVLYALVAPLAVAIPATAQEETPPATPAVGLERTPDGVLLDFRDAELAMVVSVLAEAGNLSVVYGDLPARRVTLRVARAVPIDSIRSLLLDIAAANGLTVREEGALIHVAGAPGADPDTGEPAQEPLRLHVHRLLHAQAPRVAQTLQTLFGVSGPGEAASGGLRRRGLSEALREQRIPPAEPDAAPIVDADLGAVRIESLPGEVSGDVQIVPDELTNSLLVRARDADWTVIEQAIQALDLRPLQVMIEVVIAEVRRDTNFEAGLSVGRDESETAPAGERFDGSLRGPTGGDFLLRANDMGDLELDAVLSLLSSRGDVRILSRPVLVAQNNQEAHILVGAERPFVQVFRSLPTDGAIRDQIVQYRDVGTSLTIVPTINVDGYVNLDVLQEVSTATAETQFGAPVISTREASTRLFVRDGQTVVIGGLIDEQSDRSRSGIPILKDIPVLGFLFGTTRDRTFESELFLFLTPHIITVDEDADRARRGVEGRANGLREVLPVPPLLEPNSAGVQPDSIRAHPDSLPRPDRGRG